MRSNRLALSIACACALVAVAGSTRPGRRAETVQTSAELVGLSLAEVLGRLGPPASIGVSPGHQVLHYEQGGGEPLELALHSGVVFHVAPPQAHLPHPAPIPEQGGYPGQRIEQCLERLGPPQGYSIGAGQPTIEAKWADGSTVQIAHGVVCSTRDP